MKKLPIWNFWNKCCGSVVALIYGKPGSGSPEIRQTKSRRFCPHEIVFFQKMSMFSTILEAILDPHNQTVANSVSG